MARGTNVVCVCGQRPTHHIGTLLSGGYSRPNRTWVPHTFNNLTFYHSQGFLRVNGMHNKNVLAPELPRARYKHERSLL